MQSFSGNKYPLFAKIIEKITKADLNYGLVVLTLRPSD